MAAIHTHRRSLLVSAALVIQPPPGPPDGFTGPVAPGYVPAGDARLQVALDDFDNAWQYTGPWLTEIRTDNNFYYATTIHYADGYATAKATYYGGSFDVYGPRYFTWCEAEVVVDGQLVGTVSYYAPDFVPPAVLLTVELPEGLHTMEFRYKAAGGRTRLVHDAIIFHAK